MLAFTKLLGMLLMPIGLLWLGLLVAMGWAFKRRQRGLGGFLVLLCAGFTLAGNTRVGHVLMARLEASLPSLPEHAAPLEALFVLGGGTEVDAQGRPFLAESGDRVMEAARLWHAGRVKRLVASGASMDAKAERRNLGEETRTIWLGLDIPPEAIRVIEEPCFNTRAEIQAYGRMKAKEGLHRVGLLSSAWHLPRAQALAQREGLEVQLIPSDRRGRIPPFRLWDLVPGHDGFQNTHRACWEMLGRLMGR